MAISAFLMSAQRTKTSKPSARAKAMMCVQMTKVSKPTPKTAPFLRLTHVLPTKDSNRVVRARPMMSAQVTGASKLILKIARRLLLFALKINTLKTMNV